MKNKDFEIVDFTGFVSQFMSGSGKEKLLNPNPVKIFPLKIAPFLINRPVPLFRAQYNYLLIFISGGGIQQVDGELIQLRANDALFIREGHLNAVKQILPETDGYFIYLDDDYIHSVFSQELYLQQLTFNPKITLEEKGLRWIEKVCEVLFELDSLDQFELDIQLSLLKSIMLKLASSAGSISVTKDRKWQIFLSFKSLLYRHYNVERSLEFYSDLLNVSPNYLNRCVKDISGKSPKNHLNEMVIAYSKLLLQDPRNDINQIAYDLNFIDPSYFGRLFKKSVGCTPSAYRKSLMQD